MDYLRFNIVDFFQEIDTEEQARELFWQAKFGSSGFECSRCFHTHFYGFKARPERRRCRQCGQDIRLRAKTILAHSKLPVLLWARLIFLMLHDKRGISALHAQRTLKLKSYGTAWGMLHKIRRALAQRDEAYQLRGSLELDGADFSHEAPQRKGRRPKPTESFATPRPVRDISKVLIAVETKKWVDAKGRNKEKAGFAKVQIAREASIFVQRFVDKSIEPSSHVITDGGNALRNLEGVNSERQVMHALPERLDRYLPWCHRLIANAKTWLQGTHHGIKAKYLSAYLAETIYRFNRRHDPDSLFHRAFTACAKATPITLGALSG